MLTLSVPAVADLKVWLREQRARLSRTNDLALGMDYVCAKLGEMQEAAEVIGKLPEIDLADEMNTHGMGVTMWVFPAEATQAAARFKMSVWEAALFLPHSGRGPLGQTSPPSSIFSIRSLSIKC